MIQIACPKCQSQYRLDDKFAGKKVKCKKCSTVLQIRAAAPDLPTTEAAPAAPAQVARPTPARPKPQRPAPTQPAAEEPMVAEVVQPGIDLASAALAQPADPLMAQPVDPLGAQPPGAAAAPHPHAKSSKANAVLHGTTSNLKYEISQRPDFSIVRIVLPEGRQVFAEPSAMVSMTPDVHLKAGFKGGFGKTLGRMLGGESLIINTFTAQNGAGEIMFAGGAAGDVSYYRLNGNSLYIQRGAYMLNSDGVEVTGKWEGAKGFFSGKGLVMLKASGTGDIFFNSYGAILEIDVTGGFIVDTGYVVAFEDSLQYRVTVLPGLRAGGKIKSFFFGGEGLVCQFAGNGKVWVQTRQVQAFLAWVNPFRPTKRNN